jgi:nicotinate-nucleotide pyrophosphorylase (carboxylating)
MSAAPSAPGLPKDLGTQVEAALREDIGSGDVTAALVPQAQQVRGALVTREDCVLCGSAWAEDTFRRLDARVRLSWHAADGAALHAGQRIFDIEGPARPVLTGERTAINFLQLMSGTASATRRFVDAVAGTACRIIDTRKTLPGLRTAQKYAVRCGGGDNHRMGLYDRVLIKENHIAAAGSIPAAIAAARVSAPHVALEIEVESLSELEQALAAHPDIILLDDFSLQDLAAAVAANRAHAGRAKLEASGSMSLETVRAVAATGVDFISVGSLTKHVRAIDLSMRLEFGAH